MARSHAQLLAFNRGEVSKRALARVDVAKLQLAAECQLNWMASVTGDMTLRPGFLHVGETQSNAKAKLIPFVFSKTDTAQFEITNQLMRIRINDTLVSRVAVATTVSDPNFAGGGAWSTADTSAGCSATISGGLATLTATARGGVARIKQTILISPADQLKEHGLRIVVTNGPVVVRAGSNDGLQDYIQQASIEAGVHSFSFTPVGAGVYLQIESIDQRAKALSSVTIEPAGIVSLPAPWSEAYLDKLRIEQSGDVVWVDCVDYAPRRITRRSATGYGIEQFRPDNGPFLDTASASLSLTPSVHEGNGTLTASLPFFQSTHVGALFRLFSPGQTNRTVLGAAEAYTDPIRVSGVGNDRIFGWNVSGTWSGKLTLQRSVTGADSGFTDVDETLINGIKNVDDTASYNNVVCWYRVGFKAGDYSGGAATVYFGQTSAAAAGADTGSVAIGADNTFTADLTVTASGDPKTITVTVDQSNFNGKLTLQQKTGASTYQDLTQWYVPVPASGPSSFVAQLTQPVGTATYRIGCKTGDYTSGSATVRIVEPGSATASGSPSYGAGALAGGRYGICRVTGYTSPTQVSIEVIEAFSSTTATNDWVEGVWSDLQGWPTSVCLHEGRLWQFGGLGWWGSQSDNYAGFAAFDKWGTSYDDIGVVSGKFGSGPLDVSSWGVSALRLLIGREQTVESGRSSSLDEPITPTAFGVKACSTDGADRLPALKVDQRAVYVQQSGRRVFELAFSASASDYVPRDLTRLNTDIGVTGFVATAAQRQPDPFLHFVRGDGQSAMLLYQAVDEVEAWLRLQSMGVIEDVCVMPADAIEDRVYYVVKRTIDGQTKRFIEKMALRADCIGGRQTHLLDCAVSYSGAPTTTITAAHLPNTEVAIWADGAYLGTATTNGAGLATLPGGASASEIVAGLAGEVVQAESASFTGTLSVPTKYNGCPAEVFADVGGTGDIVRIGTLTVSGGQVTLPDGKTAKKILACLGYVAPFVSAKFGATVPLGTRRRVDHLGLLLYDTHAKGLKIGQRLDALDELPEIEAGQSVDPDLVWPEYAADAIEVPGEFSTDARLVLLAEAPFPVTVGAAVVALGQ